MQGLIDALKNSVDGLMTGRSTVLTPVDLPELASEIEQRVCQENQKGVSSIFCIHGRVKQSAGEVHGAMSSMTNTISNILDNTLLRLAPGADSVSPGGNSSTRVKVAQCPSIINANGQDLRQCEWTVKVKDITNVRRARM